MPGLTIAEVAKKRPVNLRFYLTPGNKSKDNIVRAAAQLVPQFTSEGRLMRSPGSGMKGGMTNGLIPG